MAWFRIDDGFADHPKVIRCSLAAIGLWTKAGAWCSKHLTDGNVPKDMVRTWGGTPRLATELVTAGLWEVTASGYQFHEWAHRNPTRDEVKDRLAADADRKRTERREKKQRPNGRDPDVLLDRRRNPNGLHTDSNGSPPGVRPESSRALPHPIPSHPDPNSAAAASSDLETIHESADQHEPDEPDEDESRFGPEPYAGLTQQRVAKLWHEVTTHVHTGGRAAVAFAQIASVTLQRIGAANAERAVRIGFLWLARAPQGPHCAGTLKILAPWTVADRWSNDLDNAQAWWNSGGREWWREHDPKRSGEAAQ